MTNISNAISAYRTAANPMAALDKAAGKAPGS